VFFSESLIRFSNIPISKKKFSKKTILNLKFKISAHNMILILAGILNFKSKIVFWMILFWRLGDLKKRNILSKEKPPLADLLP
jgi:hypothetical protein